MSLRDDLLRRKSVAAVWGSGAVGGTTAAFYARAGVRVIAYDISAKVIDDLSQGILQIPSPEDQLGFPIRPYLEEGLIEPTTDVARILDDPKVKVHFIAVPTERSGSPWGGALEDVASRLVKKKRRGTAELVLVESTLAPGYSRTCMVDPMEAAGLRAGRDFQLAVAPRRDWFVSRDKNLQTLPRVVGAIDDVGLRTAMEVLSIVCKELVPVSSEKVAELVKPLENAFRAINIAFVDEVARAFPDLDVLEAIRAASTKWNFLPHSPGAGIGGYCIPVGPRYLLSGTDGAAPELSLINSFSKSVSEHTKYVADALHKAADGGPILLLGLAYKGEVKVHINSPALGILERLHALGAEVRVHDPLYTPREVEAITAARSAEFPQDLGSASAIAVLVGHHLYRDFSAVDAEAHIHSGTSVLDVEGTWERLGGVFTRKGIRYRRLGVANWTDFS